MVLLPEEHIICITANTDNSTRTYSSTYKNLFYSTNTTSINGGINVTSTLFSGIVSISYGNPGGNGIFVVLVITYIDSQFNSKMYWCSETITVWTAATGTIVWNGKYFLVV